MERLTISLDEGLAAEFDRLCARRGYRSRSEALRDLIRAELERARQQEDTTGFCVANLSYVYNHHQRDLAERLTDLQHRHHDLVVATQHVHLDHDHCLESMILQGAMQAVRAFADTLSAERGVRHGLLNLIAVERVAADHRHGRHSSHGDEGHRHWTPKS
ncbi:MAG: nickel-responsive transcriptional regulator NikR [Rhodocyclaceae bacterium]|nr:nickel-responsive transcriptional regulator NikR [Rhodocyclaceae bacterium]